MSTTGHLPPWGPSRLDPIDVSRVPERGGSRIEPPLDPDWDDETRLRWHAAVTAVDSGLEIQLYRGGLYRDGEPVPDVWAVTVGRHSHSAMNYQHLWTFLNGVTTGAQAARQEHP